MTTLSRLYWRMVVTLVTACAVGTSLVLPFAMGWILLNRPLWVALSVALVMALVCWPGAIYLVRSYRGMLTTVSGPGR